MENLLKIVIGVLSRPGDAAAACNAVPPHPNVHAQEGGSADSGHEILITRRPEQAVLGSLWEFPGGKIEPGETTAQALIREFREEVALDIAVGAPLLTLSHAYSHGHVEIQAFRCHFPAENPVQTPERRHVADYRWISPRQLPQFPFPPANEPLIRLLMR